MRIRIVTPAVRGSRAGNRVTAERWAKILRVLGHRVTIATTFETEPSDLLVALHARKSWPSVRRFRLRYPDRPIVTALTGTDLYRDLGASAVARQSLDLSDAIVVLQPNALDELTPPWKSKTRVIVQSAVANDVLRLPRRPHTFDVCVLGHLRVIKDPFRTAYAVRRLPSASRIRVRHVGAALTKTIERRARAEVKRNPRYHWLGERSRALAQRVLVRSRVLVLSSRSEGGANVISEAVVRSIPILASRIPGTTGLLGEDYPGYFTTGNTSDLRGLLERVETDHVFYRELKSHVVKLAPMFRPDRENQSWKELLATLAHPSAKAHL